jgi:hypothetical protein
MNGIRVVDGRNARIGGGGKQHKTFFRKRQINARLFHFLPQSGHAKEFAPAADEPHGGFVWFPFVKAVQCRSLSGSAIASQNPVRRASIFHWRRFSSLSRYQFIKLYSPTPCSL